MGTHSNHNAWWRVDLQSTRRIERVEVWNRGDCCGSRLNGFEVHVDQQECGGKNNVGQGQMKSVACGGKAGRYVKVVLAGRSDYLTLCEVKVWARDDAAPTLKCTLRSTEVRSYARGFFGTKDQAIPNSWATPNPCHATNCGSTGSKTCAGRGQCRYEGSKSGSINTGCDCNSGWRDNKCETPNNYGKVQLYLRMPMTSRI